MPFGQLLHELQQMTKKLKPLLLEFAFPTVITVLLAFVFKWDSAEVVWSFWGASFLLGIVFCFFVAFLIDVPTVDIDSKKMAAPMVGFFVVLVFFHGYTADLISKSGISENSDSVSGWTFLPFIILCVYSEIKNIFFKGFETWQQFVKFFIVFGRLQVIAWVCFYFGKYIPNILLYLAVYSICFFPIKIFESDEDEDSPEEEN